jgi:anti-anti-sigma regulatory factor
MSDDDHLPQEDEGILHLAETLDIAGAADLHTHLLEFLGTKQPITIDASHVSRVDTTALQLLCAFIQEVNITSPGFCWQQPSDALYQSADLLGVTDILGLDQVCANPG